MPSLSHLFDVTLQYTSDSPAHAVVSGDGREGVYIGSGDGVVAGESICGTLKWSLYSGNCPYPSLRRGEGPTAGLHLCTMHPGGYIETEDGACIDFDGKGYGLHSAEMYRVGLTITFQTNDPRYTWLNLFSARWKAPSMKNAGERSGACMCPPAPRRLGGRRDEPRPKRATFIGQARLSSARWMC